ncbi:hypothetical protein ACFY8X_27675 [Streptomyces tanashiensis]|uniref:hypothetical protein n=1 Tax=Streptomyces tanashiensis TaxID=67367 RepID=UPI00167CA6FF|nr:hypothetical protein [Streptomyces tanashiensis]GGY25047.1 hypothetical protein GCM10010299_34260 [Streptomyces tanashiensis]
MTTPPTRTLLRATLATLALGAVTLAGAPQAFAAPGDNGDVKVHRQGTPDTSQANEPQVGCIFRFAAFNFDGLQSIQWNIYEQPGQPGNQDPSLKNGSIAVDSNGDGHTDDITGLPTGMYKVEWTWEGQNGAAKSKVFRVDCPPVNGNGGNGNGGNGNGGNGNGGNGNGGNGGGHGHGKPPHGAVGAGGGGSAQIAAEDSSAFGVGAAVAAGLAGTAGLVLIRRSRRRGNGAA